MGVFGGTPPASCPATRQCAEWARIYLKYCLCSQKEGAALALGLISVVSWGIAEVPQIITNYRQKSTEGLSVAFLMTWIVGYAISDVFCSLEWNRMHLYYFTCLLLLACDLYSVSIIVLKRGTLYNSMLCFYDYAGICLTLLAASSNLLL